MNDRKSYFDSAKRIIIKVGSGVLTGETGLNIDAINSISRQICLLKDGGKEVLLVSSGAMASGIKKIGLANMPDKIPERQAVAAVGQAGLIMEYEKAFAQYDKKVAQILLTNDGLVDRKRYLNARNTLNTLLLWGVVPVINENDTVSVEEIKFGDNDNLAALITFLMDSDILISLTDIDGLYSKDPRTSHDGIFMPVVSAINKDIEKISSNIPGPLNFGGMQGKIRAAKKVTAAGIPMVIANGNKPDILTNIFSGEDKGTFFVPKKKKLASRKCWIAFTLKPKGIIRVDNGAATAILTKGKSLLASGIVEVEGEFDVGAPVDFTKPDTEKIGTGLVNYSSTDIRMIMGFQSKDIKNRLGYKPYDEVIHRDNLAITQECII